MLAPSACGWSASSNAPWLTIVSSGTVGTSEVQFAATANTSALARSGTLTIGGQTYTVNQAGAACAYTITGASTSDSLAAEGVAGMSFGFTSAFSGCTPLPVSYSSWITIDSTSFAGTSGSVSYSIGPNPYGLSRTGTIFVGSAAYTVVQSGSPCAYSLNAYGRVFHFGGGTDTVLGSRTNIGCTPEVGTNQPSFIFLEQLTGPDLNIFSLPYIVSPFPTSLTTGVRWGNITFGGRIVAIKQFSW
jgi:hypothetical protein